MQSGRELALDEPGCIEILEECGHLPTNAGGISLVVLGEIPIDLNVEETERFLRDHGGRICGGPGRRPEEFKEPEPVTRFEVSVI